MSSDINLKAWSWNFPEYKDTPQTNLEEIEQLEYVAGELTEAVSAWDSWYQAQKGSMKNELRLHCVVEVMDIIHACETFLRVCDQETLDLCQQLVVEKNKERGYYGD